MPNYFSGAWCSRIPNEENLKSFLKLGDSIRVYDLGASGGAPPPFCWIKNGITLINFDPDSRADFETTGINCRIAIGPKEFRKLYLNRRQTTSSLLPPCEDIIRRYDFSKMFPEEPRIFDTVSTTEVEVMGLDDVVRKKNLPYPDFLKVDVQGLTFEVLETGKETIAESVLGIQAEVEFLETYSGQKTFGAIHDLLEKQYFEIFRLTNLNRWFYNTSLPLSAYTGQDVFCDFLYLRSLRHIDRYPEFWTDRRIIQFLRLCLLYDLPDAAASYLERFIEKKIVNESSIEDLIKIICNWKGALNFFYYPKKKKILDKILDISLRKIGMSFKRLLN